MIQYLLAAPTSRTPTTPRMAGTEAGRRLADLLLSGHDFDPAITATLHPHYWQAVLYLHQLYGDFTYVSPQVAWLLNDPVLTRWKETQSALERPYCLAEYRTAFNAALKEGNKDACWFVQKRAGRKACFFCSSCAAQVAEAVPVLPHSAIVQQERCLIRCAQCRSEYWAAGRGVLTITDLLALQGPANALQLTLFELSVQQQRYALCR